MRDWKQWTKAATVRAIKTVAQTQLTLLIPQLFQL